MITVIVGFACFCFGYYLCTIATWTAHHKHENALRQLRTDVRVAQDMDEPLPMEWIEQELTTIITEGR